MDTVSANRSHGGTQGVYAHASDSTGTKMSYAVFVPDHEEGAQLPVVWFLSGLTCTHANVMEKGEYRRAASELGLIVVCPDTSPRGPGVPDHDDYDLGQGASFYLDATQAPWSEHFQMRRYIESELPALIADEFPMADMARQSIMGHSMGGHGALTMALRRPGRFRAVSAFALIVAPSQVPWGKKAFAAYLGDDSAAWRSYDACAMIDDGARVDAILVDQGADDQFLDEQLKPQLLVSACERAGIDCTVNLRDGHDHSYFTVSTFMDDHLRWHADRLK